MVFLGTINAATSHVELSVYTQSVDLPTKTIGLSFRVNNPTSKPFSCILYTTLKNKDGITDSATSQSATLAPGDNIVTLSHTYKNVTEQGSLTVYCWDPYMQPLCTPLTRSVSLQQTVTAIALKPTETTLILTTKKTDQLSYEVKPAGQADPGVTFQSSNPSVVTVDANGLLTAKSSGTAVVTALTNDRSAFSQCKVTVYSDVTRLALNHTAITLEKNTKKQAQLTATITPNDAPNKQITYKSSDTKIATVDQNGLVTYVSNGTATITATTADKSAKATCKVTCLHVKLNREQVTLGNVVGKTFQLTATVTPDSSSLKPFTYQSNNNAVAKVDSKGLITFVGAGQASIAVKTADGKAKGICQVTCVAVSLNKTSVKLGSINNPTFRLTPTVKPDSMADVGVEYKTGDSSVVRVSSKGLIRYVGPGTTTVTVTTKDGSAKATCKVTTVGVTLNKSLITLGKVDETYRLKATIHNGAEGQTVTFKSSNAKVAKVSSTGGLVKYIAPGSEVITVTTDDGFAAATCVVDTVAVTLPSATVTLGGSYSTSHTLKPTVIPDKEAYTAVTYKSSNPEVATVSSKGVVKWVSVGTATITVTDGSGMTSATCQVTTLKLPQAIKVSKSSITMWDYGQYQLKATVTGINSPKVTWHSSDESVATVSDNGVVFGVFKGKATITAKCGTLTAKCTVNVHIESDYIGSVAAYFESKDNPASISGSGTGKSYGCFQLYAGANGPKQFYEWLIDSEFNVAIGNSLKNAHQKDGGKDKTFGTNFDAKWKSLADRKRDEFRSCQLAYAVYGYYRPLADKLAKDMNFYADNYSVALKAAILSRSVQHGIYGAYNRVEAAFEAIGGFQGKTEKQLIAAIYKECGKVVSKKPAENAIAMTADSDIAKENGLVGKYMKYYYDCSPSMQAGVWQRLNVTEPKMLYAMISDPPVVITPQ